MIAADWARLLAALGFITLVTCQNHVTTIFTDPMSEQSFEHMVYNPNNDNLYIGATNHLYQLRDSLSLRHSFKTGPIKDSPNCPDTGPCSCESGDCSLYRRKLTNSVSKGLAIHEQGGVLISCWNTLQGHCDKRNLTDITKLITLKSYIVANDANASAILLVAQGPASTAPDSAALYVAATRSHVGIVDGYNDLIHALSSRKLSDFQISAKSITSSTTIKFNARFFVDYVFGFSSGGFSYFLTVQRHPNSEQFISRIVRVCQQDTEFNSYAEITLECKQDGQNYNLIQAAYAGKAADDLARGMVINTSEDVLYAVFAMSERGNKVPTKKSAICAYPLRQIRQVFTRNIQECFQGVGNTGPAHVKRIVACTRSGFRINDDYCGEHNFNQPISSTIHNIHATALKTYDDTLLTSVAVTLTHEYTVAMVGTSTGLMRKVVLETTSRAVDYGHVVIDNVRVLPEMAVTEEHVYVLTPNKVSKVRLELCNEYRSCSACLGAGDPYCGWCTLENKCSVRSRCAEAGQTRMRWLPYKDVQCINITTIEPSSVQIEPGQKKDLSLTIQNLPGLAPGGTYKCAFVGYNSRETTTAYKTDKGIDCSTPFPNTLPPIPTGTDHINMTLTVTYNNIDLVSETITFFNCQVHESCTQCTNSRFPCNWCIKNHRCVHQRDDCGPQEKLVNGIMVTEGVTDRHGPSFCPRIMYKDTVIPVPSGNEVQVSVQAINLESFQRPLRCSFSIENGRQVEGVLVDRDTINCRPVMFSYPENTGFLNVPFRITWGDNKPIDNPTPIQVKVYKCSALGNTCGSCLLLDPNLKCGWCQSDCSIKQTCRAGWLGSSSECTNPEIMKFYPSSGPREGGTNLTIEGHSLGKVAEDVRTGLRVAGVPCKLVYYSKASLIKCITGRSTGPVDGLVEVQVNQKYSARSLLKFSYVDPRIISIRPVKGPVSGGTRLTVRGEHMNAGTLITAYLGTLPCVIISKTKDAIVCVTAPSPQSYPLFLEMGFDSATIDYRNQRFVYVEDPTVTDVEPEKAIVSGGGSLTVKGTDLDAIQNPQIYIIYKEREFYGPCNVTNNTTMTCWTPALTFGDSYRTRIDVDNPLKVSYGFIMQNLRVVKNQTAPQNPGGGGGGPGGAPDAPQLLIYPDPQFDMFSDEIQFFQTKSGYLTINGRYLNLALKESDVTVRIGKGRCNVTSMALTQLTCRPPDTEPMAMDDESNPMVTVIVGNMSYPIGRLSYEEDAPGMSLTMILIVSCAGLLLLVIIAAVVLVLCRKTKQSNETVKRLQTQMDILESRVAKECKEAFAELQIDMNELTHDPSGGDRIPFWDYQTFCQRMLFPGWNYSECYPLLDPNMIDLHMRDSIDHGLNQFYGLLKIKTFLLLFIRTLESSPETFTMRDRAKVASYLSVALQSDMDYFTSILQILLAELIEKTVDSKNSAQNAKILFRRSESVAEKMLTNWFAFLLHRFLKECAGEPMYTLFQAIKQQVGKGPVDAVTSEARYSLSEDKLIRQTIDFRTMSLRVLDYNVNYAVQEYQVRVLDCDTISQVKEKILDHIYKATPYSSRPAKEDLDLEWQTGMHGRLVVQDEDMSCKVDNDFKKINTLSHYKVPDGACVRFVQKQNSNYNLNMLNEKNSHNYDLPVSELSLLLHRAANMNNTSYVAHSPSRSITPNTISLELENGVKYFHLVKSHDADGGQKEGDRSSKMVSEIYLTRLLSTKGTLQQYVDDLFETIFSTAHRGSSLPLSIKYMFDFLDDQAQLHNIADPETIHTWKSNCLPLRFWVNVIKNPDFVFDVNKSNIVDSCLSVIAQIFMDSCSPKDHVLSKDSPSSKLLYAKDIPKYKKWVERYYQDIKMMPGVSEQDMFGLLQEESRQMHDEYRNTNVKAALNGLYTYVLRYNAPLLRSLEDDQFARSNRLPTRLEYVLNQMASQV